MSSRLFINLIQLALCGISFGAAGFVCSLLILAVAPGDWTYLIFAAPVAAFLVSVPLWLLVILSGKTTLWRGAAVGALTGFLSHPPAWYFVTLLLWLSGTTSSAGDQILNPIEAVPGSIVFSVISLLLFGWLTVPVGAVAGGALAAIFSRLFPAKV